MNYPLTLSRVVSVLRGIHVVVQSVFFLKKWWDPPTSLPLTPLSLPLFVVLSLSLIFLASCAARMVVDGGERRCHGEGTTAGGPRRGG